MLWRKLRERSFTDVHVEFLAGMCVYELGRTGMGVNKPVLDVAARHGFDLSQHRARPFDASRFDEFDLIIVMEAWQAQALHHVFARVTAKFTPCASSAEKAAIRIRRTLPVCRWTHSKSISRRPTVV